MKIRIYKPDGYVNFFADLLVDNPKLEREVGVGHIGPLGTDRAKADERLRQIVDELVATLNATGRGNADNRPTS